MQLSASSTSTDFPTINNLYAGKSYCYYYAVEWFHADPATLGSMAVVKQALCGAGQRTYWYKEDYFPSEATFVPNPLASGGSSEDDGVLLFTAMHGASGKSYFVTVNAKTMKTISEVPVAVPVTFTTHGRFFN
jgi:carotenoid cleavage dioxygenase-like enzyme